MKERDKRPNHREWRTRALIFLALIVTLALVACDSGMSPINQVIASEVAQNGESDLNAADFIKAVSKYVSPISVRGSNIVSKCHGWFSKPFQLETAGHCTKDNGGKSFSPWGVTVDGETTEVLPNEMMPTPYVDWVNDRPGVDWATIGLSRDREGNWLKPNVAPVVKAGTEILPGTKVAALCISGSERLVFSGVVAGGPIAMSYDVRPDEIAVLSKTGSDLLKPGCSGTPYWVKSPSGVWEVMATHFNAVAANTPELEGVQVIKGARTSVAGK